MRTQLSKADFVTLLFKDRAVARAEWWSDTWWVAWPKPFGAVGEWGSDHRPVQAVELERARKAG